MARRNYSIVHWFPELETHKCGYCKQTNTNCSYGMWAECLTVEDYQSLIDRGWRRSGKYCYKPVMDMTCCPLYTIRCEAMNFKLSKSQKKIIKRFNKYLSDAIDDKQQNRDEEVENEPEEFVTHDFVRQSSRKEIDLDKIDSNHLNLSNTSDTSLPSENVLETNENTTKLEQNRMSTSTISVESKEFKKGLGADLSKPPCKKAKLIRLERKQQKLAAKGITEPVKTNAQQQEKSLEIFIDDVSANSIHKLKVRLVKTGGNSKDWIHICAQEYPIYKKYQMNVHGDPPEKCSEKQFSGFLFESPLQIELKQMHPKEPSYKESAKLFTKYQMFIHNEPLHECDISTFKEFLVDTPVKHLDSPDGPSCGYGSFHQQYWLDDKLIAVGVIDILPKCVSSVYFFYDPDYRHLTLGTYGSLRELYFVKELERSVSQIKYYYMGYYIHSCPKMRYKANLCPSYLLCPETYMWFPIEQCIRKLEKNKYSRFSDDIDAIDNDRCTSSNDIEQLMVLIGYKGCVPYKFFKEKIDQEDRDDYIRFGNLIGKKSLQRIVVVSRNADF